MKTETKTAKETRQILIDYFGDDPGAVSYYRGVFTVRESYFYHHDRSPETLKQKVAEMVPSANFVDAGDHYAAFRGGASIKASSHFFVKFSV